jgi:signal transduction histidine kinase
MRLSDLDWRLKIPLALTAVIVLTELVVAAALVTRTLRDARIDLEASARNLSTVLGRSLREPMVRDHLWQAFEVVSTPIAARTADNPLKRIVVLDAQGLVFVSTHPREIPVATPAAELPPALAATVSRAAMASGFQFIRDDEGSGLQLAAGGPVTAEDGTRLGTVLLEFDPALYRARLVSLLGELALISVPGLLLLVPLGWLAGRRLAQPLVQMAQALARVGHEPPGAIVAHLPPQGRDEIGRLSTQARRMLDGLARKEALEREVLASERLAAVGRVSAAIAHEINNPLGGMLNAIDTVARHGRPDPFTRKTLGLLERGLQQIRATVGALLVEARLDSPALGPQDWQDLQTLVAPQLAARGVALACQIEDAAQQPVALPAHEVRQLVLNLLLNAVKAARPEAQAGDGRAVVELTVARGPGLLAVVVGNTGPPIEPELLSRLFEPFAHPPAQVAGPHGFGLGLWVCYQIVQRLRGRIEVGSEAGWTRFAVTLPVPDSNPPEQQAPATPQET